MQIVRLADIPWEDRVNTDGWPCRAGTYYDNRETELCLRLIDYPQASVEPRHVHAGIHATTVLKNRAIVDGLTLGPLDVIVGPSHEPHGPLDYPEGCNLLSAFQGSYFHSAVENLSGEKQYRLVQHATIPWTPRSADGPKDGEEKLLVDFGAGRLRVEALRLPAGARLRPAFLAALVFDGAVTVGGETLGRWDFVHAGDGEWRDDFVCTADTTLLAYTLNPAT